MRSIAVVLLLLAIPFGAHAQIAPGPPPGGAHPPGIAEVRVGTSDPVVYRELRDARRDIERRRESGELSKREARQLRREARLIGTLTDRYGRDGLSGAERRELELRASVLGSRAENPSVPQGPGGR